MRTYTVDELHDMPTIRSIAFMCDLKVEENGFRVYYDNEYDRVGYMLKVHGEWVDAWNDGGKIRYMR